MEDFRAGEEAVRSRVRPGEVELKKHMGKLEDPAELTSPEDWWGCRE